MDSVIFDYFGPALTTASPLACGYVVDTPSSSQKKRNKFRYVQRDSLASRKKIGKPGSRRYRQWENEFFLIRNLSDTESEYESGLSDDWDESYAPSYGPFSVVFEDDNRLVWEPFVDITEERQQILLAFSDYDDSSEEENIDLSPSEIFSLLRKRSQRTLKRHKHSTLLQRIDDIVLAYSNCLIYDDQFEFLRPSFNENVGECLVFGFSEKFQRHLLHALCEFYNLVSYSVDTSAERVTIVQRRKVSHNRSSVLQFLKE